MFVKCTKTPAISDYLFSTGGVYYAYLEGWDLMVDSPNGGLAIRLIDLVVAGYEFEEENGASCLEE